MKAYKHLVLAHEPGARLRRVKRWSKAAGLNGPAVRATFQVWDVDKRLDDGVFTRPLEAWKSASVRLAAADNAHAGLDRDLGWR